MSKRTALAVLAGCAIFLGSALLFNVQPMTGRLLLPRFGGSATVWTACLVAFQLLLLAGYGYAAWITRLRPAGQTAIHLLLLAAAAAWPGMTHLAAGSSTDSLPPVVRVLILVIAGTGPAYLLLSAGSTLLQSWLARANPDWNVYRLYAISNVGSMVGLFAYPFLIEPFASLPVQQTLWRTLFAGYGVLLAVVAVWLLKGGAKQEGVAELRPPDDWREEKEGVAELRPPDGTGGASCRLREALRRATAASPYSPFGLRQRTGWWLLPLLNSFLLTAATASLTADITPMPMVWCLLLGAFLLGYVGGFTKLGETQIPLWALLTACFMAGYGVIRWQGWGGLTLTLFLGTGVVLSGGLFLCGLLYARRPPADRLPSYYLAIAAGGAAGGLLAGVVAPLLLKGVYEYGVVAAILAVGASFYMIRNRSRLDHLEVWLTTLAAIAVLASEPLNYRADIVQSIWRNRNFYGVLRVAETDVNSKYGDRLGRMHTLIHGATTHGIQAFTATLRDTATQYYGSFGGGYAIHRQIKLHPEKSVRVAVVGLGTGTLAVYGRAGDEYRFYEINPQVAEAAQNTNLFTFLADSAARVEVSMGDARLSLERERVAGEAPWDVLIVDAFSGDSVPMHLLTREAVRLFLARTSPEGAVVFHISNRFIDLLPVLKAAARDQDVRFFAWHNRVGKTLMESESRWVLMTRGEGAFELGGHMIRIREEKVPAFPVMTDEFGSVLPLIDWRQSRMERYLR
jgi:spermidine synthase